MNDIYKFIYNHCYGWERDNFVMKRLFLNQYNEFRLLKELKADKGIDEAYKDVLNKFGYDIRAELMNTKINHKFTQDRSLNSS